MKILQVTNVFSPVHGGSAEVPYQLSKALIKRGHQVTVYTSDYKLRPEYLTSTPAIEVRFFKTWLSTAKLFLTPGIVNTAKEDIKRFDVIHLHNCYTFQNIVIHYYARRYHIPYILQSHGSVASYFQKGMPKRIFDALWGKRILRDASKLIAVTAIEAETYQGMGVDKGKIEIIPHGVDFSEFEDLPLRGEFRKRYGFDEKEKLILFLGRIDRLKGLDLLVKVFADLSGELADTKLIIVGPDDGYLPKLERLIKRLEIEPKVLLTGPLYGREKLQAYVDADIYVLPSSFEIFGITVLEALACGTPVIVTDRCGVTDWLKNNWGHVIQLDKNQMKEAILKTLNSKNTSREDDGRAFVKEHFNWQKVAEQIENICKTAIQTKV